MFDSIKKFLQAHKKVKVSGPVPEEEAYCVTADFSIEIIGCNFEGSNEDGSSPFTYERQPNGLLKLVKVSLVGWHCVGPTERVELNFNYKSGVYETKH